MFCFSCYSTFWSEHIYLQREPWNSVEYHNWIKYYNSSESDSDCVWRLFEFIIVILNIILTSGPDNQPSTIEISGVNVNQAVTFTAHGAQSQRLPSFIIINDTVALETIEQYNLSLSNPSITNGVILGSDTTIHIMDDDSML